MQNLENDMDDLFFKAAGLYSLKPCENKWDDLAARLRNNSISISEDSKYFYFKRIIRLFYYILGIMIAIVVPANHLSPDKLINTETVVKNPGERNMIRAADKPDQKQRHESFYGSEQIPQRKRVFNNPHEQFANKLETSFEKTHEIQGANLTGKTGEALRDSGVGIHPILFDLNLQNQESTEFENRIQSNENYSLQKLAPVGNRGFYVGVMFGPLLSQVRHHEFTKAGFDFGLTMGYKINRKFSVETGILKTIEYYFVGGKYYSSISGLPDVDYLEGNRRAFQLALNLNYNVLHMKAANLFLSAGLTSYVGVHETTVINVGNSSLHPSQGFDHGLASYLPSYLNIALGYEIKIGKLVNLRIEPYSQIPLESQIGNTINKKITGGTLQFFNAGVHVGITRFVP